MPAVTNEIVAILQALLPGFLAAWVFYGLTAHLKPSPFERTVQALIYTLVVQVIIAGLRELFLIVGSFFVVGNWTQDVQLFWSLIAGAMLGTMFAGFANNDVLHGWLRRSNWRLGKLEPGNSASSWRWTKQTSYPSEWYGMLSENPNYVVLHLSGGRRLYGWPEEWPDRPDQGHFAIAEAEWLLEEDKRIPLDNVWSVLVPASDVELVEIMYNAGNSATSQPLGGNDGSESSSTTAKPA